MPEWNRSQEAARRVRQANRTRPAITLNISANADDFDMKIRDVQKNLAELATMLIPLPKRGGAFFYCPYRVEDRSRGHLSITTCSEPHSHYAGSRFRTEKAYRRHWRKDHVVQD